MGKVTQTARDAAASYLREWGTSEDGCIAVRAGLHDSHSLVQAFARFEAAALTTAQAEIEALKAWRDAVDDALVQHMTTAGSFPDARAAVRWLIEREQHMALDPAISADARKLVDAETEALRARVAELERLGRVLVTAIDQMAEDTIHLFAEMEMRCGPYTGKQIGEELEAFRAALTERQP